jgi:hypothetical protein
MAEAYGIVHLALLSFLICAYGNKIVLLGMAVMLGRKICFAFLALVLAAQPGRGQDDSSQLVKLAAGMFSLHGVDPRSGTEYVRLFLLAAGVVNAADPTAGEPTPQNSPVFTIECTQAHNRRELHFYVNFGGVEDIAFTPPFKPTPTEHFPPRNPTIIFRMTFEGYIHSKPFKRSWEQLPNGNYEYRNPGGYSFNLDGPRYFIQWLNSLPGFRVAQMKPEQGRPAEAFFQTKPLLEAVARNPLCQP